MRSKIFNFDEFFLNPVVKSFPQGNSILLCSCGGSDLKKKYHQHKVTGNLRITKNNKLRKLFTKGTKYREKDDISWEGAKASIMEGFNDFFDHIWGYDSAPSMADLFLHHYKNEWLLDTKRRDLQKRVFLAIYFVL